MFDLKYQRDLINREISSRVFSGRHCSDQVFYEEFKMNAAGSGFDQKKSFDSVIPMIGFGAHIGLVANLLELRAQATAGGMVPIIIHMKHWRICPSLPFRSVIDIHAGYKLLQHKMDVNDYKMDTLYTGPYVALAVGFSVLRSQ
jgi:hypothetical protein